MNALKLAQMAALSIALATAVVGSALADTLASYQIRIEQADFLSSFPPPVVYSPDKNDVSFQVMNHTDRAIYFVHGDERHFIPLSSQTTVVVRNIDQNGKYSVVDADGKVLISGEAVHGSGASAVASSSSASSSEWAQTLSKFTSSSYITTYQPEVDPEPVYNRTTTVERTTPQPAPQNVRGYW